MFNKKGQSTFALFGQVAVGVVTLALILTVVFMVLDQGRTQSADLATSQSFVNSSETLTLDSFGVLDDNCIEESSTGVTEVYNGTQGVVGTSLFLLNSGNYTLSNNLFNLSDDNLGAGVNAVASTVNISFSCPTKTRAYNSTTTLTNATQTIPGWVPLIIIASIGAALLGLVSLFRRG